MHTLNSLKELKEVKDGSRILRMKEEPTHSFVVNKI
jgi:hypothetical protein